MNKLFFTAIKLFAVMTILTGVVYPFFVTISAELFFKEKASGSLVTVNDKIVGSKLIGQKFDQPGYFFSRPSAVSYNPLPSGGSNLALTNAKLKVQVNKRIEDFCRVNEIDRTIAIPPEMVFASGSGLDPHISPEAAVLQVDRIVKTRNFSKEQKDILLKKVDSLTEVPLWGFIGKSRINVLSLNLEVDKIK